MASEALQAIIAEIRSRPPAPEGVTFAMMRAAPRRQEFPLAGDVRVAPVEAGGVPAEWVSTPNAGDAVVLYFHGGGYALGSIESHRELAARIARAAAARVLVVGYRLAPEDPFPAAVDDAVAAYRFLLAEGIPSERIVAAGDSAGGGLAAALLLALKQAGVRQPAAAVLLSPWTDLSHSGESLQSRAALDPMVRRDLLERLADAYLGGADPRNPLISPLFGDLSGLPPLLIQVGTAEVLYDDAVRFAARARAAGVQVTLEPWDEMIHVFQMQASILPEAQEAIEAIGRFVSAKLAVVAAPAGD